jgi:hypothetical protein
MAWAVIGMAAGVWVAALLAWPDLTFDAAWASFGRLRPCPYQRRHLRLRRQRADRDVLPRAAADVARASAGPVQPVVRADRLQPVLRDRRQRLSDGRHPVQGVCRAGMVCRHLAGRRLGDYFVSTCARWRGARNRISTLPTGTTWPSSWSWRSCTSSTTSPCRCRSGHAKSYSLFSGVQDAMTQWWYGHNAVAFFLTAGFLGMMYYYLPKRAGRPIFPTGCRSSASGASPSSTCGRARTTCTTRLCRNGCRRWA